MAVHRLANLQGRIEAGISNRKTIFFLHMPVEWISSTNLSRREGPAWNNIYIGHTSEDAGGNAGDILEIYSHPFRRAPLLSLRPAHTPSLA